MPQRIIAAVKLKREVLEGVRMQEDLLAVITKYARASLFTNSKRTTAKMRRDIKRLMRQIYYPEADRAGRASAAPILESLGKPPTPRLTGPSLRFLSTYRRKNVAWFMAEVDTGLATLSGETQAALARAARDSIAQRTVVQQLTLSYQEEMAAQKIKRAALEKANRALAKAESTGDLRAIKAARDARTKARSAVNNVKPSMGRFETKVQGAARDSIRREEQRAQQAAYRQSGYTEFTWVAVNGSVACPDCIDLHGETRMIRAWNGEMPGDGHTVCLSSCVCELVPSAFTKDNEQITGPVNPYLKAAT